MLIMGLQVNPVSDPLLCFPGTGKTLTGVKLVYWYVEMNRIAEKNGQSHAQVLYCGPSNSSVDVAASEFDPIYGLKKQQLIEV